MRDEYAAILPGLKSPDDATGIRHRMLTAFEYAESEPDALEQERLLTFVVVGGGGRGIEIAGEMAELANLTLAQELYSIPADKVRIMVIEAQPGLLPGSPAALGQRARARLSTHGVALRLGASVIEVAADHVVAGDERIESRTVVWATRATPPVAIEPAAASSWAWPGAELRRFCRHAVAACARQVALAGRMLLTPPGHRV